jgi:hypothetical protein
VLNNKALPKLKPLAAIIALAAAPQAWAVCTNAYTITSQAEYDTAISELNNPECDGQTVSWNLAESLVVNGGSDVLDVHSLSIIGSAAAPAIININARNGMFSARNIDLTLENLTIDGDGFTNNVAAIYLSGSSSFTIRNSTIQNTNDGAVYSTGELIVIENSNFVNNISTDEVYSSAVYIEGSPNVSISKSSFINNTANGLGGGSALQIDSSENFVIEDTIFEDNSMLDGYDSTTSTGNFGGALAVSSSNGTIQGSTFKNNQGKNYGGALGIEDSTVDIVDTVFEDNQVTMSARTEANNYGGSLSNGGAIYADLSSELSIYESAFKGNSATNKGGAIYLGNNAIDLDATKKVTIENTSFTHNKVTNDVLEDQTDATGGAIYVQSTSVASGTLPSTHLVINQSLFAYNEASNEVGALYIDKDNITKIENVTFEANEAGGFTSAYANWGPLFDGSYIRHTTFTDNINTGVSSTLNSVIHLDYNDYSNFEISHTIIAGNEFGDAAIRVAESNYGAELSYSLLDDQTNDSAKPYVLDNTNLMGGDGLAVLDPELEVLADNGGATLTRHPKDGSPVVDAGDALITNAPDIDQRGGQRVIGVVDIGAVEVNLPPHVLSTTWTIEEGTPFTFNLNDYFVDPENLGLTFNVTSNPSWMTFSDGGLAINGTVGATGTYSIGVTVTDSFGLTLDANIFITVTEKEQERSNNSNKGGSFGLIGALMGVALLRFRRIGTRKNLSV